DVSRVYGHRGQQSGGSVPGFFLSGDQRLDGGIEVSLTRPEPFSDECLCGPTDSGSSVSSLDVPQPAVLAHPGSMLVSPVQKFGHTVTGGCGGLLNRHVPLVWLAMGQPQ